MKHNQDGAVSGVAISLVMAIVLLIAAVIFGGWAYTSRQDYKDNADAKASVAAEAATKKESAAKDAAFAEEAKKPLKSYVGPEAVGSLSILFPKTWSGYVDDSQANTAGSASLDSYFAPGVVPSLTDEASTFALRVQVVSQSYSQVLQTLSGQQQGGKLLIAAYALPKVPKVVGVQVTGQFSDQGPSTTMIVLPLRSSTLQISTQGNQYLSDFNNSILPNFSFSP